MKQKDIILIIVVAFISGALSITVSRFFITSPKNRKAQVEVVDAISSDFNKPDSKYFNKDSINPTKLIQIGDSTNQKPFDGAAQ